MAKNLRALADRSVVPLAGIAIWESGISQSFRCMVGRSEKGRRRRPDTQLAIPVAKSPAHHRRPRKSAWRRRGQAVQRRRDIYSNAVSGQLRGRWGAVTNLSFVRVPYDSPGTAQSAFRAASACNSSYG